MENHLPCCKPLTAARFTPGCRARLVRKQVWLFAVAVPLLVRLPLPVLARWLKPGRKTPSANAERAQGIVQCVDEVLRRSSTLVRRGCLTRGITLYFFLCRAGLVFRRPLLA